MSTTVNQNGTGGGGPERRWQGKKHNKHEDEEAGKVFVGGLSWETTQESLLSYFSKFGEVIDCVVMKNADSGRSRGFGFVTFSDPNNIDSVTKACPHTLDGRTIDPKPCNPRSMQKPKKNIPYPKVFLGGLPSSITETDLRTYFSRYGEVMEVVIMYDQEKKKARGFGFLSFGDEDAVDNAVSEHYVNIQNKQVEIKRAEPRTQVPELSTNGPIMDQWNAPPTPNGLPSTVAAPSTPVVVTSYPNWGAAAVAVSAPVIATQQSPLISQQPFTILSAAPAGNGQAAAPQQHQVLQPPPHQQHWHHQQHPSVPVQQHASVAVQQHPSVVQQQVQQQHASVAVAVTPTISQIWTAAGAPPPIHGAAPFHHHHHHALTAPAPGMVAAASPHTAPHHHHPPGAGGPQFITAVSAAPPSHHHPHQSNGATSGPPPPHSLYWGSPPGPTPPPSGTPQELYSPHAAATSPQSPPHQPPPKFDGAAHPLGTIFAHPSGFHVHAHTAGSTSGGTPAGAPITAAPPNLQEFARMYKPVAMNGPPHAGAGVAQFPPSPAPPPPQEFVPQSLQYAAAGYAPATIPTNPTQILPQPISSYHPYRR